MKEQLEAIRAAAKQALSDCADSKLLETLRVQYLGKKGELTGILKQMGKLSAEERPAMGQLANQVRADIENALAESRKSWQMQCWRTSWNPRRWTSRSPAKSRRWAVCTH